MMSAIKLGGEPVASGGEILEITARAAGLDLADATLKVDTAAGDGPGTFVGVEVTEKHQINAVLLVEGHDAADVGVAQLRAALPRVSVVIFVRSVGRMMMGNDLPAGARVCGIARNLVAAHYQGSVFTTPKLLGGHTNSPQRLFSGSAARINPEAVEPIQSLPFAPDRFVRQLPETKSRSKDILPLSNQPRWDRIEIMPASQPVVIDGNLSEWDRQKMFRSQCDDAKDYGVEGARIAETSSMLSPEEGSTGPDSAMDLLGQSKCWLLRTLPCLTSGKNCHTSSNNPDVLAGFQAERPHM